MLYHDNDKLSSGFIFGDCCQRLLRFGVFEAKSSCFCLGLPIFTAHCP